MANTKIPSELSSTPSISDSGDATAITIDSSERVGIGVTSMSNKLVVGGTEAADTTYLRLQNTPATAATHKVAMEFWGNEGTANGSTYNMGRIYGEFEGSNYTDSRLTFGSASGNGTFHDQLTIKNDRVIVGHTTAASGDFVISNSGAENFEFFAGNSTNQNATQHYNRSNSNYVDNKQIANHHIFASGSTEIARVTGHGLTFNGDTADANALDDYEEGSFTATLINTGTSPNPTANGYYIKIGRRVFFNIYGGSFTIASNGNTRIDGLPYTANHSSYGYGTALYTHGTVINPSDGSGHAYIAGTSLYCIGGNSTGYAAWVVGSGKAGMWSGHYSVN